MRRRCCREATSCLSARDLFAVDIRDPKHPMVLKKIADRPRVGKINDMTPWRNFLFTANKPAVLYFP